MAEFYDESKFKLLKDWNWSKVIGKADDLQYQENEEKMHELLLEYLGIEDETELTSEHLQNLQDLIAYLETPYADGGLGHDQNGTSAHYYALYSVAFRWIESLDE